MKPHSPLSKRIGISFLSIATVAVWIIAANRIAPFQLDNDNIYLKTIASGEMTGTPEARLLHLGILSGWILSGLYRLTGNGIPWFGIFLCASMGAVLALALSRMLEACKTWYSLLSVYLLSGLVFACFLYPYFALTQYTLATGVAGAGAVFALAVTDLCASRRELLRSALPFLILSVWSFGMRDKGFLMLLPFLGMVLAGKALDCLFPAKETGSGAAAMPGSSSRDTRKEAPSERPLRARLADRLRAKSFRRLATLSCAFLALLLAAYGANRFAYRSAEWKVYREYNRAREAVVDYGGFPAYETHEALYRELGILPSSYEAMTKHYNILLDPNINRDTMVRLAQAAEAERAASEPPFFRKLAQVIRDIFERNFLSYTDRPLNVLVYVLYLFTLLLAIAHRNPPRAIRDLAFLIFARSFDWVYLVWRGRYPFRVTQILYFTELLLLIAILGKHRLWRRPAPKRTSFFGGISQLFLAMLSVILFSCFRFGLPVMRGVLGEVQGARAFSSGFVELEDYLEAHPDNFYYFDMSHLYYWEDTLAFETSGYENYVYMGSWMPNSPWYAEKLARAGISDIAEALISQENVYLIYQPVDFDTRDFLSSYYAEHFPGTKIEPVDVLTGSNGFQYEILKAVRTDDPD